MANSVVPVLTAYLAKGNGGAGWGTLKENIPPYREPVLKAGATMSFKGGEKRPCKSYDASKSQTRKFKG